MLAIRSLLLVDPLRGYTRRTTQGRADAHTQHGGGGVRIAVRDGARAREGAPGPFAPRGGGPAGGPTGSAPRRAPAPRAAHGGGGGRVRRRGARARRIPPPRPPSDRARPRLWQPAD